MKRRSILLLHTGGTIGMMPTPDGLAPNLKFYDVLLRWLATHHPELPVAIECLNPQIDSADATARHWAAITHTVLDRLDGIDAVIVLHGTDTLAYTASALSFFLAGLCKPVILTGAQIPIGQPGSDAEANLTAALACAQAPHLKETCIVFDGQLVRGNRAVKSSTFIGDSFASPHWPLLGSLSPTLALTESALLIPVPAQPLRPPDPTSSASVGLVKVYPGLSEHMLLAAADAHQQGLVLELYGSGTAPIRELGVVGALQTLAARQIPVIGISQCRRGAVSGFPYASSQALADVGVIPGHDLTPEAALTKLCYLHAAGVPFHALPAAMARDIAGEVTKRQKSA